MLSSNPSVPLSSIDFADNEGRRLSLITAEGRKMLTAHDGLPSPSNLTPVTGGTPTENGSDMWEGDIADERSRQMRYPDDDEDTLHTADMEQPGGAAAYMDNRGHRLSKVPSRGGIWHPDPRWVSRFSDSRSDNFFSVLSVILGVDFVMVIERIGGDSSVRPFPRLPPFCIWPSRFSHFPAAFPRCFVQSLS